MDKRPVLTFRQLEKIYDVSRQIIHNLPDSALNQILNSYEQDLDKFLSDLNTTIYGVYGLGNYSSKTNYSYLDGFEDAVDETLRKVNYNYFKTTCLPEFNQGWRNVEWGNFAMLYDYLGVLASRTSGKSHEFSFAYPLWRLYRYERSTDLKGVSAEQNKLNKEGILITNEFKLGRKLLSKVVDEINNNDIISERLKTNKLGSDKITVKNGASIELRSFDSSIRGLHPHYIIVDDFLDKSALYSAEQREKFHEVYYAEILPALEPGGNIVTVGTPFHEEDLYNDLKNDHRYRVFEYPAIFPNDQGGDLLAPDRLTFHKLLEEQKSLGSLVFSREFLVQPITDAASIFPWEYLRRCFSDLHLVNNIESFPIKLKRVVIGCDFAISGSISADYTVYTVWGVDTRNKYYLLHIWRQRGATHNQQVSKIIELNNRFKPNSIIAENNGFQRIIIDMVKERGVKNIKEFTTTSGIKKDLYSGLPSLAALFERGDIVLPAGNEVSNKQVTTMCSEFNSITFLDEKGKLESSGAHDDTVMSSFFAITDLRENAGGFKVSFIG